jgi:succinate dehydrogenase hydrophobic anchor subunit
VRPTTEALLKDADQTQQSVVAWVCAIISAVFALLFLWLLYLVAWRNPSEYGIHDLWKPSTLGILFMVLFISGGFGLVARRLKAGGRSHRELFSPLALRLWGSFLAVGTVAALIHAIFTGQWLELPRFWTLTAGACSMAVAAFVLARTRQRTRNTSQPVEPGNRRRAPRQ